jgi:hypothetical protein
MFETARDLGQSCFWTRVARRTTKREGRHGHQSRDERKAGITPAETAQPDSGDPRDTDHPTGSKQAAENAASDPPS